MNCDKNQLKLKDEGKYKSKLIMKIIMSDNVSIKNYNK